MGKAQLLCKEVQEMMVYVSQKMVASKDQLTQRISDWWWRPWVGMAEDSSRTQKTGKAELRAWSESWTRWMALVSQSWRRRCLDVVSGGAKTWSSACVNCRNFHAACGLQASRAGEIKPGDKTMVDALNAALESKNQSQLSDTLWLLYEAARLGWKNEDWSRLLVRQTLGERSLGYPDPVLSRCIYLNFDRVFQVENSSHSNAA